MILNCFTNGFTDQASTMPGKHARTVEWVFNRRTHDGITLFEDGHIWALDPRRVKTRARIGWLHEPRALHPQNYAEAERLRGRFDRILTHDEGLLNAYPGKFRYCVHAGVSVHAADWGLYADAKTRGVGMFDTTKDSTEGHRLRHAIATTTPGIDAYLGLYGNAKVETMRAYQFWVVVENSAEPNWFTEHLLDAIALGCVPLYYYPSEAVQGSHTIEHYLDLSGLLLWDTLDELEKILNHANEFGDIFYREFLPGMRANLARLAELEFVEDWMVAHALGDYLS